MLDPEGRTLLFQFTSAWLTPGGGIRRGETPQAAAIRELAEETGYVIDENGIGPVVATCARRWRSRSGTVHLAADWFFCVRVEDPEIQVDGQEEHERALITGHRWWTLEELRDTTDQVLPEPLPGLVAQILDSGLPDWPARLPWTDAS